MKDNNTDNKRKRSSKSKLNKNVQSESESEDIRETMINQHIMTNYNLIEKEFGSKLKIDPKVSRTKWEEFLYSRRSKGSKSPVLQMKNSH